MLRNMAGLNRRINYCSFIWGGQKKIAYFFYCFVCISKIRASGFIRGSKHLETNESTQPAASCFLHLFSKVWLNAVLVFHKIRTEKSENHGSLFCKWRPTDELPIHAFVPFTSLCPTRRWLATHPPSPASQWGSRLPSIFNSVSPSACSRSDWWFPIPYYNVMNNNTQGWILYYLLTLPM